MKLPVQAVAKVQLPFDIQRNAHWVIIRCSKQHAYNQLHHSYKNCCCIYTSVCICLTFVVVINIENNVFGVDKQWKICIFDFLIKKIVYVIHDIAELINTVMIIVFKLIHDIGESTPL